VAVEVAYVRWCVEIRDVTMGWTFRLNRGYKDCVCSFDVSPFGSGRLEDLA